MDQLRTRFVRLFARNRPLAYWLMNFIDAMLTKNGV